MELKLKVGSEICKITKIVVVFQKSKKDNGYTLNNMVFDSRNANRIEVRVNGYKYPQETFKSDFSDANKDFSKTHHQFSQLGYKQTILIVERL